jgi:hypothetical protein
VIALAEPLRDDGGWNSSRRFLTGGGFAFVRGGRGSALED